MPGILPMKVIKVGSSAQSRIAQACDRCRSKKIRCDGIRPSCTQCLNVGFECKTSDKLSRRAFPRGYTESLEERVRALEAEVRELKDLLDEKDEKIDVLSRIRTYNSPPLSPPKRSGYAMSPVSMEGFDPSLDHSESLKITQSVSLLGDGQSTSAFVGASSSRVLINTFKRKLAENGKASVKFDVGALVEKEKQQSSQRRRVSWTTPARMVSDQLVNIYFQEFSPLFPILHQPTFLAMYEDFMTSREPLEDNVSLAQLNLVFGIAAISSKAKSSEIESFESQWQASLNAIIMEDSLGSLQCLALAQLFCLLRGDYSRLLRYKGFSVGLSQRLGLQHSQSGHNFGPLMVETRKKVFWTLYTLDAFTAAQLGLPMLFSDDNIHCEWPVDADDEYVTETEFLRTSPGESTKLSSALALFKLARIISKILKEAYPAASSYEIPLSRIASLRDDLEAWSKKLSSHLRLQFENDKPSTGVVSSRSPLLSLAYHYAMMLITKPAIVATAPHSSISSPSILAFASSSKCIVQIYQLLEERNMTFAFCLNRDDVLLQAIFGLLFQTIELGNDSAVARDNTKLIKAAIGMQSRSAQPGRMAALQKLVQAVYKDDSKHGSALKRHNSDGASSSSAKPKSNDSQRQSLKMLASRLTGGFGKSSPNLVTGSRRSTVTPLTSTSQSSLVSQASENGAHQQPNAFARSEPTLSPQLARSKSFRTQPRHNRSTNLDYLSFPYGHAANSITIPASLPGDDDASSPADWERLLSSLDNGRTNIYDGIYGGAPPPSLGDFSSLSSNSPEAGLSNGNENFQEQHFDNSGGLGGVMASDIDGFGRNGSWSPTNVWAAPDLVAQQVAVPQSVLSFGSDEGDEWKRDSFDDASGRAIMIPGVGSPTLMTASDLPLYGHLDGYGL